MSNYRLLKVGSLHTLHRSIQVHRRCIISDAGADPTNERMPLAYRSCTES